MILARRHVEEPPVAAPARVDRRTKNLVKRLQPGEIAVIDHEDIDRMAAEQLLERRVGAVVNASACISGRYPTEGPVLLAAAGVPIIDCVGPELLENVREGQVVTVDGGEVLIGARVVATGIRQSATTIDHDFQMAKRRLGEELGRFAVNTLEYLRDERHAMLETLDVPKLKCSMAERQVLIVVRGRDYKRDLAALRSYVREMRPVLIGVDGGADALLEAKLKPDVIIGDFDSVSERALRGGAELVVHGFPDGRAPGAGHLDQMGVPYVVFKAPGTSEDVAMLLASELGAELIVAVGTHVSMLEFLDKGRAGMASTFLVRLKLQHLLVDARGVSRLYRSRIRKRDLVFLLLAVMLCVIVMVLVSAPLRVFLEGFRLGWRNIWRSLTG
ncbi:MAG: hypothetical protein QOG64_3083 [Acidimicrobiaceae bacterium]|nr:hypothetical protein [Acidimicrobiaceae bacterium]